MDDVCVYTGFNATTRTRILFIQNARYINSIWAYAKSHWWITTYLLKDEKTFLKNFNVSIIPHWCVKSNRECETE